MPDKIIIIDYGMGNLRSVQKKLQKLSVQAVISSSMEDVESATRLVLPGVGHFAKGVSNLQKSGLWEVINHRVLTDKIPVMGICLGMQLMAKKSEEGHVNGFGWIDAEVKRFNVSDKLRYKVPHMGWNQAIPATSNIFTKGLTGKESFYFVHSYHMVCHNPSQILANTNYEYDFASIVGYENIFGMQFHPEKSHESADILLNNFLNAN
jgi:glutamine amidotransferase